MCIRDRSYIPEERMRDGMIKEFTVAENTVLREFDQPPLDVYKRQDWDNLTDPSLTNVGWVSGPGLSAEAQASLDEFVAGMASGEIKMCIRDSDYTERFITAMPHSWQRPLRRVLRVSPPMALGTAFHEG